MSEQKLRIAVRMPDRSRRLYRVDSMPLSIEEMRAATLAQVPDARAVLIEVLPPAPEPTEPEAA